MASIRCAVVVPRQAGFESRLSAAALSAVTRSPAAAMRMPTHLLGFGGVSLERSARMTSHIVAAGEGFGSKDPKPVSDADALTSTLGELSKNAGRQAETRNMVLGADDTGDSWEIIDQKVNEYPLERGFKAIGTGGDDFVKSMVSAVEKTLTITVTEDKVAVRPSSKGTYLSVNIGPCLVQNGEEVMAVYAAMKEDSRMKWFL